MKELKNAVCHLDEYDIDVNKYLTYSQIQQIINAVTQFDSWAERETNIDVLVLYHATSMTKEEIEEIGHDAIVLSGLMDEVRLNIHNLHQIYDGIEYTESIARSLVMISKQLPALMEESLKKVGFNADSK